MAALILIGLTLTRFTGHGGQQVSEERAVAIARPQVNFTPEGHNIRLVRQGIPPRAVWAISFWIKDRQGTPTQLTVVLVDASTGQIDSVRNGT
jgi:hypothetical protein